jgi:predicted O-methyltransferase YrrM
MLLTANKRLRQVNAILETGSLLSMNLLFRNRKNARLFPGRVYREYLRLAGREIWESCSVDELFPNIDGVRITLEHLHGGGIHSAVDELAYLALITKAVSPSNIFEIGTFRGRSALNFALNSPDSCRVYTLDLDPSCTSVASSASCLADQKLVAARDPGVDYRGKDVSRKIVQLLGDSRCFDFSSYFGRMDIVFVDGAHDYESVLSDTQNALRMVTVGGCILWHDFANYGDYNDVTRAVLDSMTAERVVQVANTEIAIYQHRPGVELR